VLLRWIYLIALCVWTPFSSQRAMLRNTPKVKADFVVNMVRGQPIRTRRATPNWNIGFLFFIAEILTNVSRALMFLSCSQYEWIDELTEKIEGIRYKLR
jgi:hypothetical protein